MKNFNLEIALRVSPTLNKTHISKSNNKLLFFKKNIRSLCIALKHLPNTKVNLIFDSCNDNFIQEIRKIVSYYDINYEVGLVRFKSGIKTFEEQINILQKSKADLVLFLEDDYIFNKNAILNLISYAKFDNYNSFYTVFNSVDYYYSPLHHYKSEIVFYNKKYWRTVSSTTLTFACSPSLLRDNKSFFLTFNKDNNDYSIWLSLTKMFPKKIFSNNFEIIFYFIKRLVKLIIYTPSCLFRPSIKLWVQIPGDMQHLDSRSPGIDFN